MTQEEISLADLRKKQMKNASLKLFATALLIAIPVFMVLYWTGFKPNTWMDLKILYTVMFIFVYGIIWFICNCFIGTLNDNAWFKHISEIIQDIKHKKGFDDTDTNNIMSISKENTKELLYGRAAKTFFAVQYFDSTEQNYSLKYCLFKDNEVQKVEYLLMPEELNKYLNKPVGKFTSAGTLMYGVTGWLVGSVLDSFISEFKTIALNKNLYFKITVRFFFADDKYYDYTDMDYTLAILCGDNRTNIENKLKLMNERLTKINESLDQIGAG